MYGCFEKLMKNENNVKKLLVVNWAVIEGNLILTKINSKTLLIN